MFSLLIFEVLKSRFWNDQLVHLFCQGLLYPWLEAFCFGKHSREGTYSLKFGYKRNLEKKEMEVSITKYS